MEVGPSDPLRTTTAERAGLRRKLDLHARFEQIAAENSRLRVENGQLRVDMAEMRTMVADLIERQRSSAPVPPLPEAEDPNEVEELRRRLVMLKARSSTVERARPPLAHELKNGPPVSAPRRIARAVNTYGGPKLCVTPATRPAAAVPARQLQTTGAPKPSPSRPTSQSKTQEAAPVPSQPAKAGPGRSRNKKKGGVNSAKSAPTPQPRPLPPAPANMNEAWTEVVRRMPKKVAAPAAPRPKPTPAATAPRQEGLTSYGVCLLYFYTGDEKI
ncbi:uncharacterized protein LOC134201757 [Bombyx mori]|uniref:uncharacterized protein LOC134201757 n=1 Tax=Bombyx mori TaxID=7091 RepID=UPI002ED5F4D1